VTVFGFGFDFLGEAFGMAKSWRDQAMAAVEAFRVDPVKLATPTSRRDAAESLIKTVSGIAGAVALQPLPLADFFLLTPLQAALVLKIAQIYQVPLSMKQAQAIGGVTLTGLVARRLVGSLTKLLPVAGTLVSVPVAYGVTWAMGQAALAHFAAGGTAEGAAEAIRKELKSPSETRAE
jgi:uncharacterized protein (DUF697 family)